MTFAVPRCFIRRCTPRTCLAGFKATATSQGENAPACEPQSKVYILNVKWVYYVSRIRASWMIYRDESRLMEDTRLRKEASRSSLGWRLPSRGARNLAFIVPTCSISPVLTGTPWNLDAICRARDSAITIYRRVSPIVNSLLLDRSKAVQKESSPDPTSFFFTFSRAWNRLQILFTGSRDLLPIPLREKQQIWL